MSGGLEAYFPYLSCFPGSMAQCMTLLDLGSFRLLCLTQLLYLLLYRSLLINGGASTRQPCVVLVEKMFLPSFDTLSNTACINK